MQLIARVRKIRRKFLTLFLILVIICLNPGNADFRSFIAGKYGEAQVNSGRTGYFLVFSVFQSIVTINGQQHHLVYVGFCENFIKLSDDN